MKALLVHADDYNFTPGVSRGILRAYRDGIVRTTSVMANLPDFEEHIRRLKEHPALDVGVHLNVTYGPPVSPPGTVPSLLDNHGWFRRGPDALLPGADPAEIEREYRAQISKLAATGIPISHLDTHHYLHRDPKVLEIVIRLAKERRLAVRSESAGMRSIIQAAAIPTPDGCAEDFFDGGATLATLERIIATLPDGVTELVCHPGEVDAALREISSYSEPRANELALLTAPGLPALLERHGVIPVGYGILAPPC